MKSRENYIQLAIICGVLILLSIAGIVWYETSGLLRGDPDGVLLLAICIFTGTLFSIQILLMARSAGWLKFRQKRRVPGTTGIKAANGEVTLQERTGPETAIATPQTLPHVARF
jgi:hypothetical protein